MTLEMYLFTLIDTHSQASVIALKESIIDLRDMQRAIFEMLSFVKRCHQKDQDQDCSVLLHFSAEICAYYMNLMHETDSKTLEPRIPAYLREKCNLEELYYGLFEIHRMIDTMCNVNCAVIKMSLRGATPRINTL
jgi:hypothetical protein